MTADKIERPLPALYICVACSGFLFKGKMGVVGLCFEPKMVVMQGKRKLRSMFLKVRAEIRRQMKVRTSKHEFSFHYDPFSYALNFDNGNFGFVC
ncbi:hypothetical protein PVK06_006944 [Gossypium arboreum]|uniref:Uncharacterized protein n=1 Tax=Gossypium arboreum TaxID=29729 RepID=A0ABR0QGS8_GOSAR|nr:hypothetical protein PVK06_006944 [Gossypium arboreum]